MRWIWTALLLVQSCTPVFATDHESRLDPVENTAEWVDNQDSAVFQRLYPNYFVYGEPLSKLHLSFKTPIFRSLGLYFGYSQYMFWALREESKPFRDLTFNPELFYRWSPRDWGWLTSLDFGVLGHTSNGKRGADSRSIDKHYIRFNFEKEGRRWLTRFSLQGSYLYNFDPTNKDIQDYVGPISVRLSFVQLFDSWIDKSEIAFNAAPGGKFATRWDQGGYQISWSFRVGAIDLIPSFYLQYYYGYAETLLNYDEDVREFRGGVIF